MLNDMHAPRDVAAQNLRRLFVLRNVMIAFLSSTVLGLLYLDIPLPMPPIWAAIGGMLLLNGVTWLRLKHPGTVSEGELLAQLLGDIATLTLLFYFTGGYSNPLVWMYLLPLAIAAVALRAGYAWLLAGLAVGCYSALVFYHVPLSHLHGHDREGIGLDTHLAGMWLGFVVSSVLIAGFVSRIGQNLREYDRLIAEAREKALESERMMALGTLAAAAAHELGTPLATMAVLTREMSEEYAGQTELVQNLTVLRQQVARCKEVLTSLASSTGQMRAESGLRMAVDDFLDQTITRWRDTRPGVEVECVLNGSLPAPVIVTDRTLGQALVNLLDNAADASPQRLKVAGGWTANALQLDIRDFGAGLAGEAAKRAGTPFFSTKEEKGLGLGLYLARMIMGRFGGSVTLENHPQGGAVTCIRLPLSGLLVKENR